MERKVLLLVFVIFLISILAGCEPHFLDGMDDEGLVEQIVYILEQKNSENVR